MTSQSKPPEPVGIKSLLELLNAAEGLVGRGESVDKAREPSPGEPAPAHQPVEPLEQTQGAAPVERLADIADLQRSAHAGATEGPSDVTADGENRFAAHVVRGMSKSKLK
jgi:hypothetical protein